MENVIEKRNAMIKTMIKEAFNRVCENPQEENLAKAMACEDKGLIKVHGPINVGKRINVMNDAWTIDMENKVILIYLTEKFDTEQDMEALVGRACAMYRYREHVYTRKDELLGYICPIDFDIRLILLGDVRQTGDWQRKEMEHFDAGKFSKLIYLRTIEAYSEFSEAKQVDEHRWFTCTVLPFFNMARYQNANLQHQYDEPLPLCYADELSFEQLLPKEEYYRKQK